MHTTTNNNEPSPRERAGGREPHTNFALCLRGLNDDELARMCEAIHHIAYNGNCQSTYRRYLRLTVAEMEWRMLMESIAKKGS